MLTGGGAMLKGFAELAEDILDLPVRIGISSGFSKQKMRMFLHCRDLSLPLLLV